MDHFEVFGLPRRLRIDADDLQRRFYELSRRHHPDFHQAAAAEEQARALSDSARVNAAYRVLRDPIARVDYLVRLVEGRGETGEGGPAKPKAPPALLEEMFEIQEALQEARAGGLDERGRAEIEARRAELSERMRALEAKLAGPLSDAWDAAADAGRGPIVAAFKEALATRAYLRTVIDDLEAALGESQEGHVANRRH